MCYNIIIFGGYKKTNFWIMPIIVLMNQKGGVAKTTTAINLAVQAALNKPTLLIDTDEQGSLTKQFGITDPKTTVKDALLGKPFDVVNVRKNLDVVPADADLIGIDLQMSNLVKREHKLEKALAGIRNDYEYIFIDCPSNTSLVTINALACADFVILPIKLDILSTEGIDHMVNFITMVKETNEKLGILGILITQYEERARVSEKILGDIREKGWEKFLFKTRIRKNVTISEGQAYRKNVFEYSRNSTGAKDYVALGKEVLTKIKKLK